MQADFLPDYLHKIELVQEIGVVLWRDVFSTAGYPGSLKPADLSDEAAAHERIAKVVFSEKLDPIWLDAFETVEELGSDSGRDVLQHAIDDAGVPRTSWPTDLGSREFALFVWRRRGQDDRLEEIVDHARVRMFELGTQRPQHEFEGKSARAIGAAEETIRNSVQGEVSAWCKANDRGEYAEVRAYLRDQQAVFQIIHGEPWKTQMAIVVDRGCS